ncbi:MAG: transposase [Chloroflexi bacterium]|nr:transposase [Chloroflexota bacterium]
MIGNEAGQITRILDGVESGRPVAKVCRAYNVAEATLYRWRRRYWGMDEAELRQFGA